MIVVNPWAIVLIVILAIAFILFVVDRVVKVHHKKVTEGREALVGMIAVVESTLAPRGMVLIEGELWTAIIDKGSAHPGEEVTVTKVEGLRLRVSKKEGGGNNK